MSKEKAIKYIKAACVSTHNDYRNRFYDFVELPKGSIKKLIGRELSWSQQNLKEIDMEDLLKRILLFSHESKTYVPPPTRGERRKRERELKKKKYE